VVKIAKKNSLKECVFVTPALKIQPCFFGDFPTGDGVNKQGLREFSFRFSFTSMFFYLGF